MNEPTIDEQIEWQKQLLRNHPQAEFKGNAILASLERLKQIDAQEPVAWVVSGDGVGRRANRDITIDSGVADMWRNICDLTVTPLYTKPEAK